MVILDDKAVQNFADRLKNPDYLIEGCRKFIERERRDSIYVAALSYAQQNKDSIPRQALAAEALLLSWNEAYYRGRKGARWHLIPLVNGDLQEAFQANSSALEALRETELGKLTTKDLESIREVFRTVASKQSIGLTGASKALNVVVPDVFVMWDTGIREAYHVLHGSRDIDRPSCYENFIATCNEIGSALIANSERLVSQHPSFKQFGVRKSIAKMIDEVNYARFFLGEIW